MSFTLFSACDMRLENGCAVSPAGASDSRGFTSWVATRCSSRICASNEFICTGVVMSAFPQTVAFLTLDVSCTDSFNIYARLTHARKFVAQRARTDAQLFRGVLLAAVDGAQGFQDRFEFALAQILAQHAVALQIQVHVIQRTRHIVFRNKNILCSDQVAVTQDQRALDH